MKRGGASRFAVADGSRDRAANATARCATSNTACSATEHRGRRLRGGNDGDNPIWTPGGSPGEVREGDRTRDRGAQGTGLWRPHDDRRQADAETEAESG